MCGRQITTENDALALPTGTLQFWDEPMQHYTRYYSPVFNSTEPQWRDLPFSTNAVLWAAKLTLKDGTTRRFSTQAQLLKHAIDKHPFRAFFRGYFGTFRSVKPQRSCGNCNGCPLARR